MATGTLYGTSAVQSIYDQVQSVAPDLRGQLRALVQLGHSGTDPALIEAVRARLFADAAHGY